MSNENQFPTWRFLPDKPVFIAPSVAEHDIEEAPLTYGGALDGLDISLEAMPIYTPYFRKLGVLRAVQLAVPRLNKLETLELPKDTVLHYFPEDETELGISQTHSILHNNTRMIMTEHVSLLGDNKGSPRPLPMPAAQLKRQYQRENRRTRELLKPDTVMRDPMTVVVVNYALLGHLYRYPISYFRSYYKWWNAQTALWKKADEIGNNYPQRNQFLMCRLPKLLPTLALLKRGEGQMTRSLLSNFVEPEALFILEIWKWLGDNRAESALSRALPENLVKMNLIWIESDRWIMINLGLLDQWRKRTKDEPDFDEHNGVLDPKVIQKRFLRLLMSLFEVRTVSDSDVALAPAQEIDTASVVVKTGAQADTNEEVETSMIVARSEPVKLTIPTEGGGHMKIKLTANLNLDRLPEALVEETPENIAAIDEAITKDLEALEQVAAARFESTLIDGEEDSPRATHEAEVSAMIKYVPAERSLTSSVMARVDQQADAGLISGAEYRRMNALSQAYEKLPNPFGSGVLSEMLSIPDEDLKLPQTHQIPDMVTVPDKTMLKSTINDFDKQYLDKVYRKDLVKAVMNVQHAGVAVTGFQMEECQDVLNHYEKYAVQLTPAVGKVSTVYFKLPKIDEDGTYVDNGSRYRLRKQRGD